MTDQIKKWMSEFGDDYTSRNIITDENLEARKNIWRMFLGMTTMYGPPPETILEIGAGAGINLKAIDELYKELNISVKLSAIEPNRKACEILQKQDIRDRDLLNLNIFDTRLSSNSQDLVFTSGVLIHIHPNDLLAATKEIYRLSKKYIICMEYFSDQPREIKYRGEDNLMWAQDFGSHYLNNYPLKCLGYGFAWRKMTGLDNLTWWIFSKCH